MAFSSVTLTHTFTNLDGTPGSGTIELTLLKQMTNGIVTLVPGSVSAAINSNGTWSLAVPPNNDTGTYPTDAQYRVDIRLQAQGSSVESFVVSVPAGTSPLDLGTLLPQAEQPL